VTRFVACMAAAMVAATVTTWVLDLPLAGAVLVGLVFGLPGGWVGSRWLA
jgi:hypothetical protein